MENDPRIQPNYACDVPYCDERCVSHDGKRCAILGYRPGSLCEPEIRRIVKRLQIVGDQ